MDKIINNLKEIIKLTNLKVDDKTIFEQAVKMYLSKKINESKKENIIEMKKPLPNPLKMLGLERPTDKQIAFLKKNKYNGKLPETKEQAKKLISKYIEEQNVNNY